MEKLFDVVLLGPAKIHGKFEKAGASLSVTLNEVRQLVAAGALAASALELADDPDTPQKPVALADFDALTEARDEALQKANALQALNEELVQKNQTLTANLQTSESDKARMVDEITEAKREIEELKAELAEAKEPDPKPTAKAPAKTPVPKAPAEKPAKS